MFSSQTSQVSNDTLYVEDVFSAYTYTGSGSTQTITNGINLSTHGGLVWIKNRTDPAGWGLADHDLFDTSRGATYVLHSNTTGMSAVVSANSLTAFNSSGFSLGSYGNSNSNTNTYASWTFRKAAKFFDVVTWTGTGVARTVAHSLGQVPGMIVTKITSAANNWFIWHNALSATETLRLNTTDAKSGGTGIWGSTLPTATVFTVDGINNTSGETYVAYLFAHDAATDGIIQCGSFTTDGGGNGSVNHGKTNGIQFALLKCSSTTGDWEMYDTARTSGYSGADARLRANLSSAEDSVARVSSSGTTLSFAGLSASQSYIYVFVAAPTP